eukprot:scaffold177441_cov39-Prasinocladus_malaysianus.AAC.1
MSGATPCGVCLGWTLGVSNTEYICSCLVETPGRLSRIPCGFELRGNVLESGVHWSIPIP